MARYVWGEVYKFHPLNQISWYRQIGRLEGYVRFWVQREGSDDQPHSWLRVRLAASDRPRRIISFELLEFDPDFTGPHAQRAIEAAVRSYVLELFEIRGWNGLLVPTHTYLVLKPFSPQPFTFKDSRDTEDESA